MFYLNCSRCRLSVRILGEDLAMKHCPRCRARSAVLVPLSRSDVPARMAPANIGRASRDPSGVRE